MPVAEGFVANFPNHKTPAELRQCCGGLRKLPGMVGLHVSGSFCDLQLQGPSLSSSNIEILNILALAGRRHFPEELPESRAAAAERPESFGMRSAQDMYREFPALVRSSYPLYLRTAGPQVRTLCSF